MTDLVERSAQAVARLITGLASSMANLESAAHRGLERQMSVEQQVLRILDEVLSLNGRSAEFSRDTPLLGAIPELDSMAVVSLITALEDRLGIEVDDDDIDASVFASVGTLTDFATERLTG